MSGGGGGDSSWTFGWILVAVIVLMVTPIAMITFLPEKDTSGGEWDNEVSQLQQEYFNVTGKSSTSEINIWALKGVYTPYDGVNVGYTDDGWIYGIKVKEVTPSQYRPAITGISQSGISIRQADNGLYYYTSVPEYRQDIVLATWDGDKVTNPDYASVCSMVVFDEAHHSDTFFTTSSKTSSEDHFYYSFTGYRYVYQPLSDYHVSVGGNAIEVNHSTTSLSLIWYKYSTLSGISGQLTISGSDTGLSYLTADDIVREFNEHNYSSTFDMQFNGVTMHLVIRMDPMFLQSLTVADAYNAGYWSVMVYSDAMAKDMISPTFDMSVENILQTVISLFTFNLAEEYDIDGWVAFIISLIVTFVFYAVALVVCLHNAYLMILLLIIGIIQVIASAIEGVGNLWPFG